jgi:hypothetical protein
MTGSLLKAERDRKAFPRACTTPLVPSPNSYRQPRSRSIPALLPRARRRREPPDSPERGVAFQFRFTLSRPAALPCFVNDTAGAALVRVTFDRETGAAVLPEAPCCRFEGVRLV